MITYVQTTSHVIDLSRVVFMNLRDDFSLTLHFDDGRTLKLSPHESEQLAECIRTLSVKRQLVCERQAAPVGAAN